jgi:hypothetical protein
VSFYARSTVSNAKLGVAFRRDWGGGTAPDYATTGVEKNSQKVTGFAMNVPTTWTRFSHTFALPDARGGQIGTLGTDGPEIKFYVRAGSDLVGEDVVEEIDGNLAGVNNYKIYLAQVQFEYGQDASPFELNDPTSEFNRCLRYYQTTNSIKPYNGVTAGPAVFNDDAIQFEGTVVNVRYPVEIRDATSSVVDVKVNTGAFSALAKSKKGFRGNLSRPAYLNYQVESEL